MAESNSSTNFEALRKRYNNIDVNLEDILSAEPSQFFRANPRKEICMDDIGRLANRKLSESGIEGIFKAPFGKKVQGDCDAFYQFGINEILASIDLIPGPNGLVPRLALNLEPGQTVVNICPVKPIMAAYVYDMMGGEIKLSCVTDTNPRRHKIQTYLSICGIRANIAKASPEKYGKADSADAVIVDPFSTGDGITVGKRPLRQIKPNNVLENAETSLRLLFNGYRILKPGGVMIYSVGAINLVETNFVTQI